MTPSTGSGESTTPTTSRFRQHLSLTSPVMQWFVGLAVIALFIGLVIAIGTAKNLITVAIVLSYTSLGWVFRTVAHRAPDSILFNITMFSLLTQIVIATNWLVNPPEENPAWWILDAQSLIGLSLIALFLLAVVHSNEYSSQRRILEDHLLNILRRAYQGRGGGRELVARQFAELGADTMDVDFFPEAITNSIGPTNQKARQRLRFFDALPSELFAKTNCNDCTVSREGGQNDGGANPQFLLPVTVKMLEVPPDLRRRSWRWFAFYGVMSMEIVAVNLRFYPGF